MPPKNRERVITGNWKMYKTVEEAKKFVETLASEIVPSQANVWLAVPYTALFPTSQIVKEKGIPIKIGAQNMFDATEGAFTGEIAGRMLKEAGAEFVILGHSERRHLFNESSSFINKKIKRAFGEGLQPLLCVGETQEERESGKTEEILERQLMESLEGISELDCLILAYEPVWAIGTGKTATPKDAESAHLFCRQVIEKKWGRESAEALVIQYGGSVRPENAAELLKQNNVDGLLVGGASLRAASFAEIIKSGNL